MTPAEFKSIIARLGLTQVGVANLFGLSPRQGQAWALGEHKIPPPVIILLRLLDEGIISVANIHTVSAAPDGEAP